MIADRVRRAIEAAREAGTLEESEDEKAAREAAEEAVEVARRARSPLRR